MYTYKFPHPAVATDCVVFGFDGKELKILLVQRGIAPYKGMWALPGGFMHIDETAEECIKRELKEETGLIPKQIRQFGVFSAVERDPRERVISIAFYSLMSQTAVRGGDDAHDARWWSLDDAPQLAFDHDYILRQAMQRIRKDIHFEPVGFGLLGDTFTISELQRLYESILGVQFDRRNFYKKILQTGILREVEDESVPHPTFFGARQEMRSRSIDDLWSSEKKSGVPSARPTKVRCDDSSAVVCYVSSADWCAVDSAENVSHAVGRKGKLYRFDENEYNKLKEDNNFKLEF